MPVYRRKTENAHDVSDDDSSYESDDGTLYQPKETLGEGAYAKARLMKSRDGKKRVVLEPRKLDPQARIEATQKCYFFSLLYETQRSQLFIPSQTATTNEKANYVYRLVLPYLPGETHSKYLNKHGALVNFFQQINCFLSLVLQLKKLHSAGYVYLDLHSNNVLYDADTGKSYLIDGGSLFKIGDGISSQFTRESLYAIDVRKKLLSHYAPECWTLDYQPPASAHTSMDVYSLGLTLRSGLLKGLIDDDLRLMLRACRSITPSQRPSLSHLEQSLNELKERRTYRGYVNHCRIIRYHAAETLLLMINHVAQHYLLNKKLTESMAAQPDTPYLLEKLPLVDRYLFLELAGLVLFKAIKNEVLDDLDLPEQYTISMSDDFIVIQHRPHASSIGYNVEIVEGLSQKSWQINLAACHVAVSQRIRANEKLNGFLYDIDDPEAMALNYWRLLSTANPPRVYDGYLNYTIENEHAIEEDVLIMMLKYIAQNSFFAPFSLADGIEMSMRTQLSALPEIEKCLFIEMAAKCLFLYAKQDRLATLNLPNGYQVSMTEDILSISYKIGTRTNYDNDGTKEEDVFNKKQWGVNLLKCERALKALLSMDPAYESLKAIDDPFTMARTLWDAYHEKRVTAFFGYCAIC